MKPSFRLLCALAAAAFALGSTGCLTKQTTTRGGQVVDEKYVVKRPVKKVLENIEFE